MSHTISVPWWTLLPKHNFYYLTLSLGTGKLFFYAYASCLHRLHMVRHKPETKFPSLACLVLVVYKYIYRSDANLFTHPANMQLYDQKLKINKWK